MSVVSLVLAAYFIGAIPFGLIIARKFYNVDIREFGSHNTGATNVWRVLGKKPGLITLALDILKGTLPVLLALAFRPEAIGLQTACGVVAILGHNWSVYMKGRGGKGVATSAGVFFALLPLETGVSLAVFCLLLWVSKRVSVGSMGAAVALSLTTGFGNAPQELKIVAVLASVLVLLRHKSNFVRLLKGTEPAFLTK